MVLKRIYMDKYCKVAIKQPRHNFQGATHRSVNWGAATAVQRCVDHSNLVSQSLSGVESSDKIVYACKFIPFLCDQVEHSLGFQSTNDRHYRTRATRLLARE